MKHLIMVASLFFLAAFGPAPSDVEKKAVNKVLDTLHAAAAEADWQTYFALYRDDATFLGTDVSERWDMPTFREYSKKAKNGWLYVVKERHLDFGADGTTAWFDEVLTNAKYGTSRGTGVLIRGENGKWRIAQYHLTFPIPNELAAEMTKQIQDFTAPAKD